MSAHVILITGASSGFGALTARALAGAGHTVHAGMRHTAGRNAPAVAEARAYAVEHEVDLRTVELDVSRQESVDAAVASVTEEAGRVDVVVHNAGHMVLGPAESFTPEQLAEIYDTNVLSTQRLNRAVLPQMRERRDGLLVWVGSTSTYGGTPRTSPRTSAPRRRWTTWRRATPSSCRGSASTRRSWCPVPSPPARTTSPTRCTPRTRRRPRRTTSCTRG